MACRLLSQKSRLVAYWPNLRAAVRHFRAFSSYDEKQPEGSQLEIVIGDGQTDLPDPQLGLLGPTDSRFPLPGMVGPTPGVSARTEAPPQREVDLLTEQLPAERHLSVLQQFASSLQEDQQQEHYTQSTSAPVVNELECVAQDCPESLREDFQGLFPDRDFQQNGSLTVITLSQKTQNDMSGWSAEVGAERETLLENFIKGATEISEALQQAGYWADFIDPSCGKPYLGAHTNATLFETDERYRNFGFDIEDLGCCKVLRHHLWGTRAYVGSLFTDAPCDHPVLANMMKEQN